MSKYIYEKQKYGDTVTSIDDWIQSELHNDNSELEWGESAKDGIEDRIGRIEFAVGQISSSPLLLTIINSPKLLSLKNGSTTSASGQDKTSTFDAYSIENVFI